jgi:tetratricopeptide (TPR) repeat protein
MKKATETNSTLNEQVKEGLSTFYSGMLIFAGSFLLSTILGLNFNNRMVANILMSVSYVLILAVKFTFFRNFLNTDRKLNALETWLGDTFRSVEDSKLKTRNFIRKNCVWLLFVIPFVYINSVIHPKEKTTLIERLNLDYNYGYNDSIDKASRKELDSTIKDVFAQVDTVHNQIIQVNKLWGDEAFATKDYREALHCYNVALRLAENDTGLLFSISQCYFRLSLPDSAQFYLKQADEHGCCRAREIISDKKKKRK